MTPINIISSIKLHQISFFSLPKKCTHHTPFELYPNKGEESCKIICFSEKPTNIKTKQNKKKDDFKKNKRKT